MFSKYNSRNQRHNYYAQYVVIIHELVHLLIAKMLPEVGAHDFLWQYHRIMMDEGLAHFLSFPYRERVINHNTYYDDKRKSAEKKFFESQELLVSNIPDSEKKKF